MRFHCLMFVRDEGDIIAQCLDHLLSWSDGIYIYDTGSTDDTWDIVQEYARRDSRVVAATYQPLIFSDSLRGVLFDRFRDRFEPGDWVLRTDADEFYHITPPVFVRERMKPTESQVYLQWYYFRLTSPEVASYESGIVDIREDRKRPIEDRRRMYKVSPHAEPRMFRYRRSMQWPATTTFPHNAGFLARERIPIRHYPHRDPLQMASRFRLRAAMMRRRAQAGPHWQLEDWRKEIIDLSSSPDGSIEQSGGREGLSINDVQGATPLFRWAPGALLPEIHDYGHLQRGLRRLGQRIIHPALLPLLDRTRATFDRGHQVETLSTGENLEIARETSALSRSV